MKKHVLDLETEGKVGEALMELRTLGDALMCVGLAGGMASLWTGTLTHLGLMIAEKAAHVSVSLGVMEG